MVFYLSHCLRDDFKLPDLTLNPERRNLNVSGVGQEPWESTEILETTQEGLGPPRGLHYSFHVETDSQSCYTFQMLKITPDFYVRPPSF